MTNNIEKYNKLLTIFKNTNIVKKISTRTFMQISGYPHFENVCSNILSFFFTTDEEHGFKELFFQSLLESAGFTGMQLDNVTAQREVITDNNKRMDIILSNDTVIVGIENKIFSGVTNDLKEYAYKLEKESKPQGQHVIKVILSLQDESKIANLNNYINVTYDMLFEKIKLNLGNYIDKADNTWIIHLKEFMQTILNLKGGEEYMNEEMLDFINKNSVELGSLLKECDEIKRMMSIKTKELGQTLDLEKYKNNFKFNAWQYNPKIYIQSSFVIEMQEKNKIVTMIEIKLTAFGWQIAYVNAKGNINDRKIIENKLKKLNIDYFYYNKETASESKYIVLKHYPYNASYEQIQEGVYYALDNIKLVNY